MDKTQLGAFIAQNRKALGLTQKDLASKLYVTDKAVSKWERGLSYPDVTLLEPLADIFHLSLTELVSCGPLGDTAEDPTKSTREEQAMKDVLRLSTDSVASARRQGHRWIAILGAVSFLLAVLLAVFLSQCFVSTYRTFRVVWKESTANEQLLYVENDSHLLRLKCAPGVDYASVDVKDPSALYDMQIRWNRLTFHGTVETCQKSTREQVGSPMHEIGGVLGLDIRDRDALFGFYWVSVELVDRYPNPDGNGYLSIYSFWRTDKEDWRDHEENRLLTITECLGYTTETDNGGYAQADVDGDGITELLVRTKWPEKPCIIYDWEDGIVTETWSDTVPAELKVPSF